MVKKDYLGLILAVTVGTVTLAAMIARAFFPQIIIPNLNVTAIVLMSVVSLVLDYYIAKERRKIYWFAPLYGALVFGIFPWVACFSAPLTAVKSAILGAITFSLTTFLFDCLVKRISAKATKVAPLIGGFLIFLASQVFIGII